MRFGTVVSGDGQRTYTSGWRAVPTLGLRIGFKFN
jgi:hypothetical protein